MYRKIDVVPAEKAHVKEILEMGYELFVVEKQFEKHLPFSKSDAEVRYEKELKNPQAIFYVLMVDENIAGYAYAHLSNIEHLSTSRPECELEVLYIKPEYRGHHFSSQLIEKVVAWAKNNGAFRVRAGIYAQNACSLATFEKNGFTPYHVTYTFELET